MLYSYLRDNTNILEQIQRESLQFTSLSWQLSFSLTGSLKILITEL